MSVRYSVSRVSRVAWGTLLTCFLLFWVMCIGLSLGLYMFMFASTVPMPARIDVGRGTALLINPDLTERGERDSDDITGRVVSLSMDSQAQAVISLYNGEAASEGRMTLVTLTLSPNSEMRFQQAEMPRFNWTNAIYNVSLRDFRGQLDVVITEDGRRPVMVQLLTQTGRLVQLKGAGRYAIESNAMRVRVTTVRGEAVLFSDDRSQNRIVPEGFEGVLLAGRSAPSIYAMRRNLIANGLFGFATGEPLLLPERWGCSNVHDDQPRGSYFMDALTGRVSLRLFRGAPASSHGETRCIQPIAHELRDVSQFNFVELEVVFRVVYQSLSDCGQRGSECPLMLRINYTDSSGVDREWFQGFYSLSNPTAGYPPRCESCTQDHLQVNLSVPYIYRTGNLINLIPPWSRPARINSVEFYASGHQYDVLVDEIGLQVGYADTMPELAGS